MEPIDFVRFFEEFRARVPDISAVETSSDFSSVNTAEIIKSPTGPVPRRHELLLEINRLNEERAKLEERLALLIGGANPDDERSVRASLTEIQDRRLKLLAELQKKTDDNTLLFISYAHQDGAFVEDLRKQLAILKRLGIIKEWYDREITAGTEWKGEIDERLNSAQIVLLLISSDFMASDYCYDVEMKHALKRHESGAARVIPVILRPCMWDRAPFARLQALPTNGKPASSFPDRDAAFLEIAQGIRAAVDSISVKCQAAGV